MKFKSYFIIILIIISLIIVINSDHHVDSKSISLLPHLHQSYKISYYPTNVPVNSNLSVSSNNITITKTIFLNISSVTSVTDFYIVLNTQGAWPLVLIGTGEAILNFSFEGINNIIYLSFNDFNSGEGYFKQLILVYHNITLDPTSKLKLNMTLDVTSYLSTQYYFSLYIKSLDLYFIESPLIDPVIIPSWQYGQIATYGTNFILNTNTLDYIIFLPTHSDINLTIITSAPIIIKNIEIDHASWVNLPNLTLTHNNFTFNFITDESSSLLSRDLTLYYYATTNLPLKIIITAEVVIFTIINPIQTISQDQNNIRIVIAIIITFVPLGYIMKNRRKKLQRIRI